MEDGRGYLIRGLVHGNEHLYATSPSFRTAIDTLARMLPVWVEGFALGAVGADRRMEQFLAHLQSPLSTASLFPTGGNSPTNQEK